MFKKRDHEKAGEKYTASTHSVFFILSNLIYSKPDAEQSPARDTDRRNRLLSRCTPA